MAEFNTFIKLHRSVLESAVFTDAEVLRLWIYILCKASVEDRIIAVDGKVVNIKKGQFITGRKKLAEQLGTTESKAYRSLKLLQKLKCIRIEVNNRFSLVTVVNWDKFQNSQRKVNNKRTSGEQQANIRRTSDEHQVNTNKNDKECINNDKNERKKEEPFVHSAEKNKLKIFGGKLGGGVVLLSEEQEDKLLEMLSVEEFDKYVSIVRDCELAGKHFRKPHYQAILEMVNKDRGMCGREFG